MAQTLKQPNLLKVRLDFHSTPRGTLFLALALLGALGFACAPIPFEENSPNSSLQHQHNGSMVLQPGGTISLNSSGQILAYTPTSITTGNKPSTPKWVVPLLEDPVQP